MSNYMQTLHRPEGHPDNELIDALEPDQMVSAASVPFPRLRLRLGWKIGFWALRIYVLLITIPVIYAFIVDLHGGIKK